MKKTVLESRRNRVDGRHLEAADRASKNILKRLADLRSDLKCIGKAIRALERVALFRLGQGTREKLGSFSRKQGRKVTLTLRTGGPPAGVRTRPRLERHSVSRAETSCRASNAW
jgi:hypothetical protein